MKNHEEISGIKNITSSSYKSELKDISHIRIGNDVTQIDSEAFKELPRDIVIDFKNAIDLISTTYGIQNTPIR